MTNLNNHLKKGMLFAHEKILLFICDWLSNYRTGFKKIYLSDIRKSKMLANTTYILAVNFLEKKGYLKKIKIMGIRNIELVLTDKGVKYCEILKELEKIRK